MQTPVISEQLQAARREIVQQVEQGVSAREARVCSTVPMHRTTVYRLLKRVQHEGEQALVERRHGHPFNDRVLNRDLTVLCERVNQASPRLPDDRRLSFTIHASCCSLVAQTAGKIP